VVLHKSLQTNFTRGSFYQDTSTALRKINVDIRDKEYLDFLSVCIDEELSVEEKLKNIIRYHVIVYKNRKKLKARTLFD